MSGLKCQPYGLNFPCKIVTKSIVLSEMTHSLPSRYVLLCTSVHVSLKASPFKTQPVPLSVVFFVRLIPWMVSQAAPQALALKYKQLNFKHSLRWKKCIFRGFWKTGKISYELSCSLLTMFNLISFISIQSWAMASWKKTKIFNIGIRRKLTSNYGNCSWSQLDS